MALRIQAAEVYMLFLAPVQRLWGSLTVSKGLLDSLPVAAVCWQLYFLVIISTHYPTFFAYLWGIFFLCLCGPGSIFNG